MMDRYDQYAERYGTTRQEVLDRMRGIKPRHPLAEFQEQETATYRDELLARAEARAELLARAEAAGITPRRNWKLDTLRRKIEEAEAEA